LQNFNELRNKFKGKSILEKNSLNLLVENFEDFLKIKKEINSYNNNNNNNADQDYKMRSQILEFENGINLDSSLTLNNPNDKNVIINYFYFLGLY